jgi:hypothetical protein
MILYVYQQSHTAAVFDHPRGVPQGHLAWQNEGVDPSCGNVIRMCTFPVAADDSRGGMMQGPGDKVSIILTNSLEFIVAFWGTVMARAVAAPLNPQYVTR